MKTKSEEFSHKPQILSQDIHEVAQSNISTAALKVLQRLHQAGFDAYIVGGGVRDLILGEVPKDFDIATDALPEQAHEEFRNSRLIGRRFRLLHVRFGREIIEVATFRGHHSDIHDPDGNHALMENGMIVRDNVFGNMEQDAWRRDFSINSLYFDVRNCTVVDYTGGFDDLKARVIRIIGEPEQRYIEDPVRMLRAIRFAAKLDFSLAPSTEEPIKRLASKLSAVAAPRLFDEVLKLFMSGNGARAFDLSLQYGLFQPLFPETYALLGDLQQLGEPGFKGNRVYNTIRNGLVNTDKRIAEGKPVTPAFLFAILLWEPVKTMAARLQSNGMGIFQAFNVAGSEVVQLQCEHVFIPKRFSLQSREIWSFQLKLSNRTGQRAFRALEQSRFRAAYDFLVLRATSGENDLEELAHWWTQFQEESAQNRQDMVTQFKPPKRRRRRARKN